MTTSSQAREGFVQAFEVAECVVGPGTRVVGDFVVAEVEHVDGGSAAHHVHDGDVGREVAQEGAGSGAYEGIEVGQAVEARLDVVAFLLPALPKLAADFPEEDGQRAGEEIGVEHEQVDVAGAALVFFRAAAAHVGHGEHGLLGVAVQHVVDAGAAAHEALAVGVALVEFGGVADGDVELVLALVVPAVGGDVVVVAEHDAGLAGGGHGGQAAVDMGELVAVLVDHALEGGHEAGVEGVLDVPVAEAVDLDHHQTLAGFGGGGVGFFFGAGFDAVLVEGAFFLQVEDGGEDGVEEGDDDAADEGRQNGYVEAGKNPGGKQEGHRVDQVADDEHGDPPEGPGNEQDQGADEHVDDGEHQGGGHDHGEARVEPTAWNWMPLMTKAASQRETASTNQRTAIRIRVLTAVPTAVVIALWFLVRLLWIRIFGRCRGCMCVAARC